jgi:hypothetical protein
MDQVRGMSLDDDETGKAELRVNLEHKMANLSMARLQATLNEYQASTQDASIDLLLVMGLTTRALVSLTR